MESISLDLQDVDVCQETMIWNRLYKVNKDSYNTISAPVHSEINIFTDGSKMSEGVGASY